MDLKLVQESIQLALGPEPEIPNEEPEVEKWEESTVHDIIVDAFNSAGERRPSELIAVRERAAVEQAYAKGVRDERRRQRAKARSQAAIANGN
jgi:hypothetical protein